jgi:hypothetical protein
VLGGVPDAAGLEAGLRGVSESLKRQLLLLRHGMEAELAKKLDVRTFLASSSANAAANAAAASAAAAGGSAAAGSPLFATDEGAGGGVDFSGLGSPSASLSRNPSSMSAARGAASPLARPPAGSLQPSQSVGGRGSASAAAATIARLSEKLKLGASQQL